MKNGIMILLAALIHSTGLAQLQNQSALTAAGGQLGSINGFSYAFSLGELFTITGVDEARPFRNTPGIIQPAGSAGALPVRLIDFTARRVESVVELSWTTSWEVNSDHFEVERSTDARSWQKRGELRSRGNSQSISHYQFDDEKPLPTLTYYRLKLVDRDGTFMYSRIVSLNLQQPESPLKIYPNPVQTFLYVEQDAALGPLTMTIYDGAGRLVVEQAVEKDQSLDLSQLKPGPYQLRFTPKSGVPIVRKMLKQ